MTKFKIKIHKSDWPFLIASVILLVLLAISILKQVY